MADYDIGAAFKAIEDELVASMIRNMDRHRAEETKEGYNWSMWQAEQLKALEKYKKQNQKRFTGQFKDINGQIAALLQQARADGNMQQEAVILNAIKNGFKGAKKASRGATAEFFRLNDRKMEALIKATTDDMERAETAVLRMANDQYRKIIYNAQVYANSGAGTYEKAVDMATRDTLAAGLNCMVYKNGARHTISDWADMAIRTANKRAYLQGEGEKRREWGIATVIVNKRGNPCPKCLPFCGKVLIDDVWSGGSRKDGNYPLMSTAIEAGLYHPRCKDSHTTYFPGISTADDTWTEEELEAIGQSNAAEARRQYAGRQAEKFGRLAAYSLDKDNQSQYKRKADEWESKSDILKGVKRQIEKLSDHDPVSLYDIKSKYRDDILGTVDQAPDSIRRFIEQHRDEILFINEMTNIGAREGTRGIRVNLREDLANERGKWCSTFHEIGHRVDRLSGRMSADPKFEEALKEDFENLVKGYQGLYNKNRIAAYRDISQAVSGPKYHSVSDLFGGVSGNQCVGEYAHREPGYWQREGMLGGEAFAHFFEAMARNDTEKMDILRQSFPKAYNMFENMMEDLI